MFFGVVRCFSLMQALWQQIPTQSDQTPCDSKTYAHCRDRSFATQGCQEVQNRGHVGAKTGHSPNTKSITSVFADARKELPKTDLNFVSNVIMHLIQNHNNTQQGGENSSFERVEKQQEALNRIRNQQSIDKLVHDKKLKGLQTQQKSSPQPKSKILQTRFHSFNPI